MFLEDYGTDRLHQPTRRALPYDILTAWSMENAEKPVNADYRESCRYLPQIEVDEALWGQGSVLPRIHHKSTNPDAALWQTGVQVETVAGNSIKNERFDLSFKRLVRSSPRQRV